MLHLPCIQITFSGGLSEHVILNFFLSSNIEAYLGPEFPGHRLCMGYTLKTGVLLLHENYDSNFLGI